MFRFSRNSRPVGWPFWLLIAAWFCANIPQIAIVGTVSWFANARHFSHQQRLHAEVASFLSGKKAAPVVAETKSVPAKPFLPAIPIDGLLKKTELAMQSTSEFLPPAVQISARLECAIFIPDSRRASPPHEPPRARFVS